jgi:ferredoxin/flavodoxin---NADP+ reductase
MNAHAITAASRYRVAIVGGGPSGFYATEALLRSGCTVLVDMFERLPVPYGLVRFGVAPDHPKLKQVTNVFDRIAMMPGFRFFGGIEIGRTISIAALKDCYHAVILATGASVSRLMQIPGEKLQGSYQAADFVAWYNGHPDHCHLGFDLSGERVVIVGHGNVALDVARVLAKTADELRHTDIAAYALEVLDQSRIREIHIVGRRSPNKTKFSAKELEEFTELAECDPAVDLNNCLVNRSVLSAGSEADAAFTFLHTFADWTATKRRRCVFRFCLAPFAIDGQERVERILFRRQEQDGPGVTSNADVAIDCDLVFSSLGRRTAPLGDIPYDENHGTHANVGGRIVASGTAVPGFYVCGWGKRGANGTIGTNRGCSVETVNYVLADLPGLADPRGHPDGLLIDALGDEVRHVDYRGWQRIDAAEIARGKLKGKPREKFVDIDLMVAEAGGALPC